MCVSGNNPSPGKEPLERNRGDDPWSSQKAGKYLCFHLPAENLVTHGELSRVPLKVFPQMIKIRPRIMATLVLPNES